jgi:hypothetical protein
MGQEDGKASDRRNTCSPFDRTLRVQLHSGLLSFLEETLHTLDRFSVDLFLAEVGADMPIDWDKEALNEVKNAVVEAFTKMGVRVGTDERNPTLAHPRFS